MDQLNSIIDENLSLESNPCIKCGACCAYFRISFYWREAERDSSIGVPQHLTVEEDSFKRCMKGTNQKRNNQCTALVGRIGERVSCQIYENRPTPCRNFKASYSDGKCNKRCDEARKAHGLQPLRPYKQTLP